jgi:metacaspase-1
MAEFDNGHALIVGISNYQTVQCLPPTILADARDLADLLQAPGYCGYPARRVRLLLDADATLEGLRQGLRELAAAVRPDDTAVVFFSGHGARCERGRDAGNYLIPVDCDLACLGATALSAEDFTKLLNSIRARRVVVLLDACHSGGTGEVKDAALGDEVKAGLGDKSYAALAAGTGRVIIASSRTDEVSWVLQGMKNSLFTHHLLEALRGAETSRNDGMIRILDVFDHLAKVIPSKAPQHPILKAEVEDNFPMALDRGGWKAVGRAQSTDSRGTASPDWWKQLEKALIELYPLGPNDNEAWSRAGGDRAQLSPAGSGRASWHDAVRKVRLGGGGTDISAASLVSVLREDFPNHPFVSSPAKVAGDSLPAEVLAKLAEAEARAAEAALELAKFRTPRRDILRGHESSITDKLKLFAGIRFDTGLPPGDGEAADFLWDLQPILIAAGWEHINWTGGALLIRQGPDRPVSGSVGAVNVEIHLHPSFRNALLPAATALISALNETGLAAIDARFNTHSETANAIHLLIGPKR